MQYETYLASISLTCRRFREVLLASPQCWKFLCFSWSKYISSPLALEIRLSRSAGLCFDLIIDIILDFDELNHDGLLKVFKRHLHRCRTLYCLYPESDALAFRIVEGMNTPSLQHLMLSTRYESLPLGFASFGSAQLTFLCLEEQNVDDRTILGEEFSTTVSTMRLDTITRLSLDIKVTRDVAMNIMSRCISVQHLHYSLYIEEDGIDNTQEELHMPHLISLQFYEYFNSSLVGKIVAPSLKQIELPLDSGWNDLGLHHNTYPLLRRLSMSLDDESDVHRLGQIFDHHPLLEDIQLRYDVFSDLARIPPAQHAIDALRGTRHDSIHPRASRLKQLSLDYKNTQPEDRTKVESEDSMLCSSLEFLLENSPSLQLNLDWYSDDMLWKKSERIRRRLASRLGARVNFAQNGYTAVRWPNAWLGWHNE